MSKLTIIQLLNKIANNEEVPKKFKYRRENFVYMDGDYSSFDTNVWFSECHLFLDNLNDEIEIIEEKPKKIEEIPFNNGMECFMDVYHELEQYNYKINDLTKAVNYLLEKESE